MTVIDLTGQRFGRLTVLRFSHCAVQPSGQRPRMWICECDCGTETLKRTGQLRSGHAVSCGCALRDALVARNTTHGLAHSCPEYGVWKGIRSRCSASASAKDKAVYFDKGIAVCDRWLSGEGGLTAFECFFADMGARPSPKHSIDRIDGTKGYSPANCRWADALTQSNNRHYTRRLAYRGQEITIPEASLLTGLKRGTIWHRLKQGWSVDRALSTAPIRRGA